jgi:putative transposase
MDESRFRAAIRYVERNPVRAGMVIRAEQYPGSSARFHCGLTHDDLLDPQRSIPPMGAQG